MALPTLRQLQYLVTVVETRHFGQAAQRCFVTQSTLSTAIRELEELLGVVLLERSKRQVIPTPLGEQLAARAALVLAQVSEFVELARHHDNPLAGPLHLGVIPTIGPFLLPRVLPGIRRAFPELELYLVEDQSERLVARLQSGNLDAAILALPFASGDLEQIRFWQENFYVALPARHRLATQTRLTTEMLPQDELLLLEEGHCLTDHALAACKLEQVRNSAVFRGGSLYTLIEMVAGGLGITFVPEMGLSADLLRNSEIVLLPLDEPGPHREIGLLYRPGSYRRDAFVTLSEQLHALLERPAGAAAAR